MYKINTKKDMPDIGYMEMVADKLMRRGIRLSNCIKLRDYYVELRATLKSEIQSKYGIDNPNSTNQIAYFLNDMSNRVELTSKNDIINICYDSENDKWTSKAEALEKLSDLGYEFAQDLLDYRHAKKYAESIESIMDAADSDGLIHPLVTLGKTNRINYSKPGLLTIPKKLLWHLIAPYTAGNVLYSVDIKNQEPNILINMTGAQELKYALESKDGLYETIFKQCFQPIATANILVDTLPENRIYSISELKKIGTISPANYSPSRPMIKDVYYNGERVIGIETVCVGSEKGVYPELPSEVSIEVENGTIYNLPVEWESADKKYKRSSDYSLQGKIIGLDIKV
ncbi:MAG: Ig-like domain-containing protein, partial [Lachnospiraceae bacterium]|nr:Ig-like domain-containing protein [Lachnospiraceae bacterium]